MHAPHFQGVATRCRTDPQSLQEVVDWLHEILQQEQPVEVISEIHARRGSLQEALGDVEGALRSYQNALWLSRNDRDVRTWLLQRLGNAYGRAGDWKQMQFLYEKSSEF